MHTTSAEICLFISLLVTFNSFILFQVLFVVVVVA